MSYFNDPRFIGTGIPWYKRADYARILEIMVDAELLPVTFDQWQGKAEKIERDLIRAGTPVHRVHVDPQQFVTWCAGRGLHVDADGRRAFASDPANWDTGRKH